MDTAGQILLGTSAPTAGAGSMDTAAQATPVTPQGEQDGQVPVNAAVQGKDDSFQSHMTKAVSQGQGSEAASDTSVVNPAFATLNLSPQVFKTVQVSLKAGNALQPDGELLPGVTLQYAESLSAEVVGALPVEAEELSDTAILIVSPEPEIAIDGDDAPDDLEQVALQAPAVVADITAKTDKSFVNPVSPQVQQVSTSAPSTVAAATTADHLDVAAPLAKPTSLVEQGAAGQSLTSSIENSDEPALVTSQIQSSKVTSTTQGFNNGLNEISKPETTSISSLQELTGSINAATATQGDKSQPALTQAISSFPKVEGGASYQQLASVNLQTSVTTQVAAPGWGETVMQRVMWMSSQHVRSAEIQLDPPELGSLMVKINTANDQTTVNFISSHAAVRDALDQSLPRLKDLMNEQGLDLVDVDVSEHSGQGGAFESDPEATGEDSSTPGALADANNEEVSDQGQQSVVTQSSNSAGLINAYA